MTFRKSTRTDTTLIEKRPRTFLINDTNSGQMVTVALYDKGSDMGLQNILIIVSGCLTMIFCYFQKNNKLGLLDLDEREKSTS